MKVLFDFQAFDMQTHGGVSRCFAEIYNHKPADVDMTFAVLETGNTYLQQMGYPQAGTAINNFLGGMKLPLKRLLYKLYYNCKYGHPELWDRMPRLNKYYTEQLLKSGDFDVFHPTFFDPYFLEYIGETPFVLTIHDMIPELYPKYYPSNNEQIVAKKILVPKASHIVAVSERTRQDAIRILGIPEDKISVVYHGADPTPYYPSVGPKYDFEYILYVGERHMYKNFLGFCRDVIPVLRRHRELKVFCTGKPFTDEELFFFDAFGMKERFVHAYIETNKDMMDLYHNAVAFVYPSAYEGFGLPILEAYKADCPIMLNRASCFPEIAGDAAVYFTMGKEESDFEEQFETLYHLDSNEREALLDKQRERLKLYSWEKSARELAAVYKKIVDKK